MVSKDQSTQGHGQERYSRGYRWYEHKRQRKFAWVLDQVRSTTRAATTRKGHEGGTGVGMATGRDVLRSGQANEMQMDACMTYYTEETEET